MGEEAATAWPADVIHVNEDGWVLINRGRWHGVTPGLRLLVVGADIRELRDLFAPRATDDEPLPVALRIRRTYELLEVIHAEDGAAIAVAARTPPERRPQIYGGPAGEVLVWVPLSAGFTWPRIAASGADAAPPDAAPPDDVLGEVNTTVAGDAAQTENAEMLVPKTPTGDTPPEVGEQDDERWEEALPLNGVSVGDLVLPATPAAGASLATAVTAARSDGETLGNPFEAGRTYDWMQPRT
jgi:hypothetical protein